MRGLGHARRRYHFTPELLEALRAAYCGNKEHVSAAFDHLERKTGWPRSAFKMEAKRRGWARCYRPWNQDEIDYLRERLGTDSARLIARRLHRSLESVQAKADSMRLSRRVTDGYSFADLQQVFGEHYNTVRRWVDRGWLGRLRDGRVSEPAIKTFLRAHPREYSLRRTDEAWFKGMFLQSLETVSIKSIDAIAIPWGEE
jgi:hypothetical protein